jgi:phosphomannomutase
MDAIEFGTDGWRATLDVFTAERVRIVGQAVADYLAGEGSDAPVVVGYDARETSRGFAEELARVLGANGFDVVLPDRDCPTPCVAWTVWQGDYAGALMVTASHNPPEYNGVKFLPPDGAPSLPEVTDAIVANLREPEALSEADWGSVEERDLLEPYLDHLLGFVDGDLTGLDVAYDAMHGSGRGVTDDALTRAGADVTRLRCERNPDFGGTPPEPKAERLGDLVDAVVEGSADLGIANDGDADRIGVVTPERGYLDPNLLYVAVYDYLLESAVGDAVRTVSTSFLVDRVAAANEAEAFETAVGFKWVAQAMKEHDALFGGEESGGYTVRGHVRNKDGVLLALLAAAAHAERSLDERVDALLAEHGEIVQNRVSVACPNDRKATVLSDLEQHIPELLAGSPVEKVVTVDGFKLLLADGSWVLMRPSGTEPKMRVYAESSSEERVQTLLAEGRDLVEPLI